MANAVLIAAYLLCWLILRHTRICPETDRSLFWSGIIFVLLQVLDGHSTIISIQAHGTSVEANGVIRHFFTSFDYLQVIIVAKALSVVLGIILVKKRMGAALTALNIVTGIVVTLNYLQYYLFTN